MFSYQPLLSLTILGLGFLNSTPVSSQPVMPAIGTLLIDTVVDNTGNPILIQQGTIRDKNLFHSFSAFSPGTTDVRFEVNPGIENIFARVIGGMASDINSTISVDNPPVNLYLINPNGIVFGSGARLNIGGSFYGSTASSIVFPDAEFSTVNPTATSPLSVQVPTALEFAGSPGSITLQGVGHNLDRNLPGSLRYNGGLKSAGLAVGSNQTLALLGNGITFDGGNALAEGGHLEIASVGPNSQVDLTAGFDYGNLSQFADVVLNQQASIDASGDTGGSIQVRGQNISVTDGSNIFAFTEMSGTGGVVNVNATGNLNVNGFDNSIPSGIFTKNTNSSVGGGGDVTVMAGNLAITGGGQIWTGTFRNGAAGGDITVNASDVFISGDTTVGMFGRSGIYALAQGNNNPGGSIFVTAENLTLQKIARLTSTVAFDGDGGQIQLNIADQIRVQDQSNIASSTFGAGNAGSISVNAADVRLSDGSLLTAQTQDAGNAGTVNLNLSGALELTNGSQISAFTEGSGQAGDINVSARAIALSGTGLESSAISSKVGSQNATGNAGDIALQAQQLSLTSGAQISADTFGKGNSGNISLVVSGTTTVSGTGITTNVGQAPSSITNQVNENATGQGGILNLQTNNLIVSNGGVVSGGTTGGGVGGTVTINADGVITVTGAENRFVSGISSRTRTAQNAGNLSITTGTLEVSDRGTVTVESKGGTGDAGNLNINARYIRLSNNASITGATDAGQGGNLNLNAMHIIMLFDSEISTTAGSANQPGDGGNITIDAATVTGLFNSDIASNSFQGRGGRIVITAQGIFVLEFRLERTPENDITAISLFDPQLNGEVVLNTPDIDPTQALIEVPVVESPEVVEQVCGLRPGQRTPEGVGTFSIEGPALPNSPTDTLQAGQTIPSGASQRSARDRLIAQGWGRNTSGELVLTGQRSGARDTGPGAGGCGG